MYYLCEKYYKSITVQYCIDYCVRWAPRLTLLDLMNKLDLGTCSRNGTHSYVGDLLYLLFVSSLLCSVSPFLPSFRLIIFNPFLLPHKLDSYVLFSNLYYTLPG